MKKALRTAMCALLLVAGLCGCEKWTKDLFPEIDLGKLPGTWEKVYPEGVQDAGLVRWTFYEGDPNNGDFFLLDIHVSDVFAGDSDASFHFTPHQNGYPLEGAQPQLYLYGIDHDWSNDNQDIYKPEVLYQVMECSDKQLILKRVELNINGPSLLEGDVTFKRVR
ncbi:MAG: hypothetical protein IJ205_00355 [Bacteroidales bacterium]|nr:hypothetical protein [Bacteroidales bacterium]